MNPKWMPTHLGAEPKKLAMLGGLVLLLGGVYWMNQPPSAPAPLARPVNNTPAAPVPVPIKRSTSSSPQVQVRRRVQNDGRTVGEDFRPTLRLAEDADVSAIDPVLHVELLAKARKSDANAGARSLFDFSQAPPPPPPVVKAIKPGPVKEEVKPVQATAAPTTPVDPPKPPPPAISLKYYGFAGTSAKRRAFFLDGEDIFVVGENEMVKGRYRIVRISANSAVVEDVPNKNQQTLPLVEELGG